MAVSDAIAARRLRTLLADIDYGPKLARLTNRDARPILDLLSDGTVKQAKDALDKADEQRRITQRAKRIGLTVKQVAKLTADKLGVDAEGIEKRYKEHPNLPLDKVAKMTAAELRSNARYQRALDADDYIAEWWEIDRPNPFFYR